MTTPRYFRPLRLLWPGRSSTRECRKCRWEGFHLHEPETGPDPLASDSADPNAAAEPALDFSEAADARDSAPLDHLDLTSAFAEADASDRLVPRMRNLVPLNELEVERPADDPRRKGPAD